MNTTATLLRTVTDHASAVTFIKARQADLLTQAEDALELAQVLTAAGNTSVADEYIVKAQALFVEAQRFAPQGR